MTPTILGSPARKFNIEPKVRHKHIVQLKMPLASLTGRTGLLQGFENECTAPKEPTTKQVWKCPCCGERNEYDALKHSHTSPQKRMRENEPEEARQLAYRPAKQPDTAKRPRETQSASQQATQYRSAKKPKWTPQPEPKRILQQNPEQTPQEEPQQGSEEQFPERWPLWKWEQVNRKLLKWQTARKARINLLHLPGNILEKIFDYTMEQPDQPAMFYTKTETHVHPELLPVLMVNRHFYNIARLATYRVNTFILDSLLGLQLEWLTENFIAESGINGIEFRIYFVDNKWFHEDKVMNFFDILVKSFNDKNMELFPKNFKIVLCSPPGVSIPKGHWVVKIVRMFSILFASYGRRPRVQFKELDDPSYFWIYPIPGEDDSMFGNYKVGPGGRPRPCKLRHGLLDMEEGDPEDGGASEDRMEIDDTEE